jgi:hypothetical protein
MAAALAAFSIVFLMFDLIKGSMRYFSVDFNRFLTM